MIYDVPVAKTAADVYMRRLLGNVNESLPLPTNKVEVFLYLLCGGDYNMPQPITSEERFLAYMLGASGVTLPTPQTRLETYMDKVCRRGSNAVVQPKTRYELYWWLWAGVTEITSTSLPVIFQTSLPYLRNYQIYGNTNTIRPNAIDNTQFITPDSTANYSFVGEKTVNLFDINGNTSYIYENCHIQDDKFIIRSIGGGATSRIYWRNVYPAGTYFITAKFDGGVSNVRFYSPTPFNNATYNGYYQGWFRVIRDGIAVTFEQDFTVGFIVLGSIQSYGEVYDIQIQNGIMGTNFEPYGKYKIPITINGNTTNVYIDEPLRKISDYADYVDYGQQLLIHNTQKIIFTGNEVIGKASSDVFYITIDNYKKDNAITCLCTHYTPQKNTQGASAVNDKHCCFYILGNQNRFYIRDDDIETVDDFKLFLAAQYESGTPVTVWYILVESEVNSIDLPQLPTQDGTNTLTVETTVAPSKVVIEA